MVVGCLDSGQPVNGRTPQVQVKLVPEFARPAADFSAPAPELSTAEIEGFRGAWLSIQGSVEAQVTADALSEISRYDAVSPNPTLETGWTSGMPMEPLASTPDGRFVLFGQRAEQSPVALPTNQPLVFRRLVVLASYDRSVQSINTVYATIRGWAEE